METRPAAVPRASRLAPLADGASLRVALTLVVASLMLAGCGTPGAPLPPSLKLPDTVVHLTAVRTGNQVSLAWTMPRKTTDKLLIKGQVPVRVCRKEGAGVCQLVPGEPSFAPRAHGSFEETLPTALASGAPRSLAYFVELENSHGRTAGPSNAATVLAGQAPAAVLSLTAEVRKQGVVLHWAPDATEPSSQPASIAIRLHRTLLNPELHTHPGGARKGMPGDREAVEQSLLVEPAPASAQGPSQTLDTTLDKSVRFGRAYEYRVQRVARLTVDGKSFELAGPLSDPVRVEAHDIFPPDVPSGLAAVAVAADPTAAPPVPNSIDLSWIPVTDADLAGYAVYRRDAGPAETPWQRISPAQPVVGPGFHDADVQPGHTYRYAVTAIDQAGHESARSPEAEETVPNP
jgi:hypothetical protein